VSFPAGLVFLKIFAQDRSSGGESLLENRRSKPSFATTARLHEVWAARRVSEMSAGRRLSVLWGWGVWFRSTVCVEIQKGNVMLRKMVLAVGAVTLLSGVSWMTPLGSYARIAAGWATQSASDAVPLEWEIKRARQMIGDLQPEIAGNAKQIAREKIELARLQRQAKECGENLDKSQSEIERLSKDLKAGGASYTYAGHTYTSAQVRDDLASRFNRFKTRRETYEKLQQMVAAREASLRAAGQRMDTLLAAKSQLEVEVENLQARVGSLRLAQTASPLNLDDSRLAQTRELLDDIATRIDVEEEVATAETFRAGQIDLDVPASEDLLDAISTYLNGTQKQEGESLAAIVLE
jgi:predicted  nucleic acid-binding Zn-ribbon protein